MHCKSLFESDFSMIPPVLIALSYILTTMFLHSGAFQLCYASWLVHQQPVYCHKLRRLWDLVLWVALSICSLHAVILNVDSIWFSNPNTFSLKRGDLQWETHYKHRGSTQSGMGHFNLCAWFQCVWWVVITQWRLWFLTFLENNN